MLALFSATDLIAAHRGQLALGDTLDAPAALAALAATVVEVAVMPAPWELIPREYITGQGVLGA